jgi:hypothetical protein
MAVALTALMAAGSARAGKTLRNVSWSERKAGQGLESGTLVPADDSASWERLRIEKKSEEAETFPLVTIEDPGITSAQYALRGRVRCQGVGGQAVLQMWSHFPDGEKYYSRTTGSAGPLRPLKGTSDWRWFVLPFTITKSTERPVALELVLMMGSPGAVEIGPLELCQYQAGEDMMKLPGQWWGERMAGLFGGLGGALLGVMGAVIGVLGGSGKAKGVVLGLLRAMVGLGVLALGVGLVALATGQPYAVYFPLLLCGGIATVVPVGVLPGVRKRYEMAELRRMEATDLAET